MTRKKANGSKQSVANDAFRNIIEAAPMGIHFYQLEPDGRLVFSGANAAADRFLGMDSSQFIGQTIEEAFPDLVETEIPEAYRRVAQTGEHWQTEQVIYQEGQISGAFEVHAFQITPGHMAAAFLNITGRKQTEARLQVSEEKFRTLYETMNDAVMLLDEQGFFDSNPATLAVFGCSKKEQFVGQHPARFSPPLQPNGQSSDTLSRYYIEKALREGTQRFEWRHCRLDGTEFPAEVILSPLPLGGRSVLQAQVRDLTEHQQLECQRQELLAHRERQVQIGSEVAQVIATAPGLDQLFSRITGLVQEKFGYYHVHLYLLEENNLVMKEGTGEAGRQLKQAGHKISLATEQSLVARAAREGRVLLAPNVEQEPDWLPNPLLPATKSDLAAPIKLGDRVLGVLDVQDDRPGSLDSEDELLLVGLCGQIASAIDKTRLVEQLEQQHNLLQAILHSIPAGVFVVEAPTGRPILSNERAEELLGRGISPDTLQEEAEEVYPAFVYGTDEPYPAERMPLARGMLGEAATVEDMEVRRPDGQNLLLQVFGAPIYDADGEIVASVAVIQDTTERKQAEYLLARRANELLAVAELSTAISSILDTDLLLQEMVDLTKSRFDLYHAHIYVLDEAGENLVLAAGAGDVGRKMAAEGWHIPLAQEQSLVARAARSRQAVVANDVRSEPDFFPNPALPATRSEMALPLVAGEVLLGVLDVQSNLVGRFTEEDARLQTTLAAQAAVALQNARLFADQERMSRILNERVKELNCLNEIGRAVAEAPEAGELLEWVTERIPPAMRYPEECAAAIEYEGRVYGVAETMALPCQMAHALRVDGEVVGRVYIAYRQKREFLNEESALLGGIASRLSGYLESRGLLAQVQTALEEVEQSQEFLRTVIDNIPLPVFIIDVNDVYLGCNRAFLEYIQRPGEDIVGKSIYDLYDQEIAGQYHEADQQIYRNPGVYQFEVNIQRVDGSPATLIYNRATFTHRDGSLAGQVATILDITERKAVEESLLRNETQLSEALQLARLAYWEFDVQTQMFTFNDQLYTLFGTTAEEQGGYQVSAENFARKFIHPDEAATVGVQIQQALETTDPDYIARFESRTVRSDGQEGYIAVQLKVAKDEQGRTVKLYGTNQDITEQKLAELERERLLAEVEATYRQYVRHEWEQFLGQRQVGRWRVEHQAPGASRPANGSGDTTVVPIDLRGQPIGAISLQDVAPNHHWTEDDQTLVEAVSEQLALTVENLRLFSATQQQAVREHMARQITDKMRSAPDVDSIIQIGLGELAKALGAARAYVRLSPKQSKSIAEAEAETPDIEAIRSQLKHNGHKPPAASTQLPDRPADTSDADLAGKVD